MSDAVDAFMQFFRGLDEAFGTGAGGWVKRPPSRGDFAGHLRGEGTGIGIAPLMRDGRVWFGAIDLDEPDFDLALTMQSLLPGTTWIERSRSGNAHVWAFFSEPAWAWAVRGILRNATEAVGRPEVEVFPKQDALRPGMLGNYINLPYHGDERPMLLFGSKWAPEGYEMPLVNLLTSALANLNDPADWERRARFLGTRPPDERANDGIPFGESPTLHACAEHIIANRESNPVMPGARNVVFFHLAKQLLHFREFNESEAWTLLELVNQASPEPLFGDELGRIFQNAMRGGYTSTGCDAPEMSPYVRDDCPIARGETGW